MDPVKKGYYSEKLAQGEWQKFKDQASQMNPYSLLWEILARRETQQPFHPFFIEAQSRMNKTAISTLQKENQDLSERVRTLEAELAQLKNPDSDNLS